MGRDSVKETADDSKAKVSVNSPNLTPGGTTKVTVTVTAESGAKKTYTISVKRAQDPNYVASNNNDLSGITIDGFLLSPVFSAENTEYVIWLPYETENVTVSGTPADSKANVTVEGGDNLTAGVDNEIKVICTAEDGTQKVYTIIAKRAAAHGAGGEDTPPATQPTVPADPTQPSTAPTTPASTEPQCSDSQQSGNGIQLWLVIVIGVACLAAGAVVGLVIGKKSSGK